MWLSCVELPLVGTAPPVVVLGSSHERPYTRSGPVNPMPFLLPLRPLLALVALLLFHRLLLAFRR